MAGLTIDSLKKMRESEKKRLSLRDGEFKGKITVHLGTCGIAAGAREIMTVLIDELETKTDGEIMLTTSGCAGFCSKEPMITVELGDAAPVKYGSLNREKTHQIMTEHILGGQVVAALALGIGSERAG